MALFRRELDDDRIRDLVKAIADLGDEEKHEEAWEAAKPLRQALSKQPKAAEALCHLIDVGAFELQRNIELGDEIVAHHADNVRVMSELGSAAQSLRDMRYLNDAAPDLACLQAIGSRLQSWAQAVDDDDEYRVASGLASVAGVLGRGWDNIADAAHQRLLEMRPERWAVHYNYGLFLKNRGRFEEGQSANQRALELSDERPQNVVWNLGICATGAGDAETALRVWKDMGQKIEMGRFGLPEGGYPATKVRLAQYPLAERRDEEVPDEPGQEETIWVERLSPCHGIVRSALYNDIGVDYGDVVLFDGAPITYHKYGDKTVPVHPHICTLARGNFRIYRFAGTQPEEGYIDARGDELESETIVYVHSELYEELCSSCWESTTLDHSEHTAAPHRVVTGKVCAPPDISDQELQKELDDLFDGSKAQLYIPDLSRACGDTRRAEIEERRFRMIEEAS